MILFSFAETIELFYTDQFTFSIHGKGNFPLHKEKSDFDTALEDGTGDAAYLDALERSLDHVLRPDRADLAIYIAGADPFLDDRFGRLSLSKNGLNDRDCTVFHWRAERNIPVAITMGGGYSREVSDTVQIHFQTVRITVETGHGPHQI